MEIAEVHFSLLSKALFSRTRLTVLAFVSTRLHCGWFDRWVLICALANLRLQEIFSQGEITFGHRQTLLWAHPQLNLHSFQLREKTYSRGYFELIGVSLCRCALYGCIELPHEWTLCCANRIVCTLTCTWQLNPITNSAFIFKVTMARYEDAINAIMDPNPCIDGRKANVNLAVLGAKPRTIAGGNSQTCC